MREPSKIEIAYALKEVKNLNPDAKPPYILGSELRRATTPDETGLSNLDVVAMKRGYKPSRIHRD
jgi:hypothetical protein